MTEPSRLQMLAQFLEQNPSDAFARYGLAMEYSKAGQTEQALAEFNKLLELHPDYTNGYFMAAQTLERNGRTAEAKQMLESGVEAAKREVPDLILMDVVMPNLNGFQATRAITREATTKHIPVIMCTTKGQETDRVWGMRQGARDYIVKPASQDDLLAKIKALG